MSETTNRSEIPPEETKPARRNSRTRRAIAGVATAGLLAMGAGCSPEFDAHEKDEIALIEQERQAIDRFSVSKEAYILHAGVAIRENPSMQRPASKEDNGNIDERIGDGWWLFGNTADAYVVRRGIIYEDGDDTWLGFTIPDKETMESKNIGNTTSDDNAKSPLEDIMNNPELPEEVQGPGVSGEYMTAQELAGDMRWVLISELLEQTNENGEPFAEAVSFYDDNNTELHVASDGRFFGIDTDGNYSEVGQVAEVDPATIKRIN